MKRIYYLLVMVAVAFTACQKQPLVPLAAPLTKTGMLTLTLQQSDYQLLPSSVYAHSSFSFNSAADANAYIPTILAAKESALLNSGSTATVTYTLTPPPPAPIKAADSLFKDVAYTVTTADYAAVTGGSFQDFSAAQVLAFLAYKYPNPVANQLAVISYTYYNGANTAVVNSFLYLNGAWKKIYQISPAQFASINNGYNDFSSSDLPNLPAYFNGFLKADPSIADTVKAGDVEYVSYKYFGGGTFQRVMALVFDGNNFVPKLGPIQATGSFLFSNGSWTAILPVPTISHTINSNDVKLIAASSVAPANLLSNLGQYGDFETSWTVTQLDAAFILVLNADYPSPQTGINYVVTYLLYTGGNDVPTQITFHYNGSAFVAN